MFRKLLFAIEQLTHELKESRHLMSTGLTALTTAVADLTAAVNTAKHRKENGASGLTK